MLPTTMIVSPGSESYRPDEHEIKSVQEVHTLHLTGPWILLLAYKLNRDTKIQSEASGTLQNSWD